jgi:hypothetical protein
MKMLNNIMQIELKRNEMQISAKCILNMLITILLKKELLKNKNPKRHISISIYFGIG